MDDRLYANATYLTDMDRKKALSEVGYDEEEVVNHIGFQRLSGTILMDSLFGTGKRYSDLFAIKDGNEVYAVSGLPFGSRLFVYTIWGTNEKRTVANRQVFKAKRVSWEPIRMTKSVVIILLKELLKIDTRGVDYFFSQGAWNQDQTYLDSSIIEKENSYVFSLNNISSRIFTYMKSSKVLRQDLWRILSTHENFAFLCHESDTHRAIYPLKMVLRMMHQDIDKMIVNLKMRPLEYAFDATIESYWAGGYRGSPVKVPEISFDSLERLSVDHPDKEDWWLGAARLYHGLKTETWKERHCATPESDLSRFIVDTCLRKKSLKWLLENSILTESVNGLILSEINEWEFCLKEALEKIILCSSQSMEFGDPSTLRTRSGHLLCDEQKRAYKVLSKNPILLVDGTAGSGKTDFLMTVSSLVPHNEILATAYQGTNAGDLGKIFPFRAFTTHKILYQHAARCTGSLKDREESSSSSVVTENLVSQGREDLAVAITNREEFECPMKGIKILVIDEVGTQSLDVFSKLLSAVVTCGSVEKIVLTGDSGQLPPINPGDILLALRSFLGDRGMYVRFISNHRQNKGARLLAENAKAISKGSMIKFGGKNCVHVEPKANESAADTVVRILEKWKLKEYDHNVVVRTNELRRQIIPRVEKHFGGFESMSSHGMLVNRKMSFTQNDYDHGVVNNEILKLDEIRDFGGSFEGLKNFTGGSTRGAIRRIQATSLDGRKINIEWNEWARTHCRKASCTTVNVFQGSQIPYIIHVMPYFCSFETRERIYTIFTRPTKGIFFIGNIEDLERAVKNPETKKRGDLVNKLEKIPESLPEPESLPKLEPIPKIEPPTKRKRD